MRVGFLAAAASIAMASTEASAQVLNLSGPYRCVQGCVEGLIDRPAFITQHGWDLSLVNEAGMPSRAWIDRPVTSGSTFGTKARFIPSTV
jgi:hypothetical protein